MGRLGRWDLVNYAQIVNASRAVQAWPTPRP